MTWLHCNFCVSVFTWKAKRNKERYNDFHCLALGTIISYVRREGIANVRSLQCKEPEAAFDCRR